MKLSMLGLSATIALVIGGCADVPYAGPPAVDFDKTPFFICGNGDGRCQQLQDSKNAIIDKGHATYAQDLKECTAEVSAIKQHLDVKSIANATLVAGVQGAAMEAPSAAINPLIVAVGAIVQGVSAFFGNIDAGIRFLPTQRNYRIDRCMDTRAAKNREYTPVN